MATENDPLWYLSDPLGAVGAFETGKDADAGGGWWSSGWDWLDGVAGTVGDTIGNLADSAAKLWSVDYLTDKFGDGKARPELVWDGRQVVPATGTPLTGYSSGSNNLLIVGGLAAVGLALVFMGRK